MTVVVLTDRPSYTTADPGKRFLDGDHAVDTKTIPSKGKPAEEMFAIMDYDLRI